MKKGTTPTLVIQLSEKIEKIKSVIISIRGKYAPDIMLQKEYPESGTLVDGRIYLPLSQKETDMLPNKVLVECQLNLASGAVAKTDIKQLIISDTLATKYIDGAASDGNEYNVTFSLADKIENDQLWRPHVDEDGILTWTREVKEDPPEAYRVLGLSAYEIAVKHGYKGTEGEWNDAVNAAKTAAEKAAEDAKSVLDSAITSANIAETNLTNATNTASILKTNLETAADTANTSKTNLEAATTNANTAKTNAEKAQANLQGVIDDSTTKKTALQGVIDSASTAKSQLEQVIADTNDAGVTQVQAVNDAGATQVAAVEQECADQIQIMQSHLVDYVKVEEVSELREDLGNVKNDIYQISHGYEKVTDGLTEINGYGITKVSDTSFTIEKSANDNNLIGYPVKAGDKVKITGTVFPVYNALGYVLATTTDVPSEWSGSNSLPMLSVTENDYFCGNNEQVWKSYECELTIPNGAKMIWIRGINPSISIYKEFYEPNVYTKEETDSKINSLKGNINKDIYTIDTLPTVTTGTITKQHKHSRQDRDAYLWSLSETGTLIMENIKVDADKNDVVGLWVYVNAVQLTYANNTDGLFKIYIDGIKTKEIFCAYDLLLGWNYVPLGITDSNPHTVEIIYALVRGEYLFGIDTIELNYRKRPKVLLSFDMANWSGGNIYTDNRYEILSKYGFTATFCNPHEFPSSDLNALLKEGWDWSVYGGQGTRPNYDTGSIEEWCAYLQTNIDLCASVGLFNPISYFSPANRMSVVLEQALKKVGFKVSRIAGTTTNIKWFDDKDGLYISTVGIGGTVTAEEIIEKLDDAINSGSCICLFTHAVQDELTDNMNCTKEVYETIISALRNRVDNGLCDVVTFREFYQHWCPEGYAELMENRHEKEKQYILNKLSN